MRTPMLVVAGLASVLTACSRPGVTQLQESGDVDAVARIDVSPSKLSLAVGARARLVSTVEDSAGAPVAGLAVSWASRNSSVASVDAAGNVTAVAAGTTTIVATVEGIEGTSDVTITQPSTPQIPPPVQPSEGTRTGWYVAPDGSSSGDGSSARPWSLTAAVAGAGGKVRPGDTIWVRGGTYADEPDMTVGGTADAYVVLSGYPGETAVVKKQFDNTASYVVIQSLTFEGPLDGASNQVRINGCHHVVFMHNEIRNGNYHAGLSVDETHHLTIAYNYIHDNGVDVQHDHGIYFKTTNGPGTLIANNLLVRNAARGLSLHDNSGVGVYDVVVAHNTIVGNGSTGLLVNDGDRITVVNNVAVGNGDKTDQAQIRILAGDANRVWNNLTWHASASSRAGIENTTGSSMAGNFVADPMFSGSAFTPLDLRLRSGSPAISKGLSDWVFGPDYAGRSRPTPPAVGAFEQ